MDLNLISGDGGDWQSQIGGAIARALEATPIDHKSELRCFREVMVNAPKSVSALLGTPLSEDRLQSLLEVEAFETVAREFSDVEQIEFMVSRRSDAFFLAVITVPDIEQDFVGDASSEAFAYSIALARAASFIASNE